MSEFPKRYDFNEIELKWQKYWVENNIYRFDREDRVKPTFSIDTPPPYPSGEFHVGNAFNHTYIDFVARYMRMKGYNVLFPQGWDCHGLPTEVRVERTLGRSKREIPSEKFLEYCRKYTLKWIKPMKDAIKRLGCSIDWSTEYLTMNPDYWRRTQLSFIEMYRKGLIYIGTHPIYWCPRCETAIAEAEVEYVKKKRKLHYYYFTLENGEKIMVASTRPELLGACVALAVNPDDERYKRLIGKKAVVPIYGRKIPIVGDEDVEIEFGTGIVMICTYGDKTDVKWQKKHGLPEIIILDSRGKMNDRAGPLKGLSVEDAREKIVEMLKEKNLYVKSEEIESEIGTCWRCHTPIEILPEKQWFVKTRELAERVLEEARKIKWIPEYSIKRLENWVNSLDWDWVISRQRLFATPIPVWYCKNCGEVIVAEPEWVPIDPRKDKPKIDKCRKCGSTEFIGEKNVLDTWMDSSITAAVHAGWPDNFDERLFPADLQPNGYDIIRTWDYYLIVRGVALFNKTQFKIALINGMVRGTDGRMMHKSYGNYIELMKVIEKYGADAFRLWVSISAATGSDIRFSWENVDYAKRFLVKVWNVARFLKMTLKDFDPNIDIGERDLRLLDKWIINLFRKLVLKATNAMDNYDFMTASTSIIDFTWHKLCDHYIEAVKYRVTMEGENISKRAAQYTLYNILLKILQLLSPFTPHIVEEIYHQLYVDKMPWKSITISEWPKIEEIDEKSIKDGDIIISLIAAMRRIKHDLRIPLNQPVSSATIFAGKYLKLIKENLDDIKYTLKIEKIELKESGEGRYRVEEYPEISFNLT